jgi:hypothetical protein
MFHLAEHLGQPLSTILAMTPDEFNYWFTYFRVKHKQTEASNG